VSAAAAALNPEFSVNGQFGLAVDPALRKSHTATGADSNAQLERDADTTLDLRSGQDKSLPTFTQHTKKKVLDYQHLWTAADWKKHVSRRRYLRHIYSFPRSRIFKRTAPMLAVLLSWAATIVTLNKKWGAPVLRLSLPVHTMFTTFVAFLLTLRTNHSLSRLLEGRLAWGRLVLMTRNLSQLIHAYVYPVNDQLALKAVRHLSLFGWTLKARMRVEPDDDVIDTMLTEEDARYVKNQRKRPVALLARIRQIVAYEVGRGTINDAAHKSLESDLLELNRVYGMCERIRMSPIPPMYTRHTSRLLMFWLFALPLALDSLGMGLAGVLGVSYVAGFMTLGLDEISMQLEQPFRLMPMHQLSGACMRDVVDPFVCPPPGLFGKGVEGVGGRNGDREELEGDTKRPKYWLTKLE
jgi:putative membrane protein